MLRSKPKSAFEVQEKEKEKRNNDLIKAAKDLNTNKVRKLLNAGADINYAPIVPVPSHFSKEVKSGLAARPEAKAYTALLHAINNRNSDLVSLLVDHRADCNKSGASEYDTGMSSKYARPGFNPSTPLALAISKKCDKTLIQALIDGGANLYTEGYLFNGIPHPDSYLQFAKNQKNYAAIECILAKLQKDGVSEEQYNDKDFRSARSSETKQKIIPLTSSTGLFSSHKNGNDKKPRDTSSELTVRGLVEYLKENSDLWRQLRENPTLLNQASDLIQNADLMSQI